MQTPEKVASVSRAVAPIPPMDAVLVHVAIVIPTYKQPLLLEEALESVLRQRTDFAYATIVIDDGCPLPETQRIGQMYAQSYPGHIYYLRKSNGGLSAARNSGIELALQLFPGLEAVYFLDSDNRILPHALQRHYDTLKNAPENKGWAYPNIQKIGIPQFCDTSGVYNPLEHLIRNISEAGSMVHRRMLDAGARYDERMKLGYEDWEFWMQGQEKGLEGIHVSNSGFHYRYRPESMVSGSMRNHQKIMDYIHSKHKALYAPAELLRREARHAPRYGIWLTDADCVLRFTQYDTEPFSCSQEAFLRQIAQAQAEPRYGQTPAYIAMMPQSVWEWLRHLPVSLEATLWHLEVIASEALYATLILESSQTKNESARIQLSHFIGIESKEAPPLNSKHAIMIGTKALAYAVALLKSTPEAEVTAQAIMTPSGHKSYSEVKLIAGRPSVLPPQPVSFTPAIAEFLAKWKSTEATYAVQNLREAQSDIHRTVPATPQDYFYPPYSKKSCFPCVQAMGGRAVAIILSSANAKFASWLIPLAQACKDAGYEAHLFLLGNEAVALSQTLHPFAKLHILSERVIPGSLQEQNAIPALSYFGTPALKVRGVEEHWLQATWLGFDAVINIDAWQADVAMGALKKDGVRTGRYLLEALADEVTLARIGAYEPAYQLMLVEGERSALRLEALGVAHTRIQRPSEGDDAGRFTHLIAWLSEDL